jgi:hypothetical protein
MQAARLRISELTDRRLLLLPLEDVVANLNRFPDRVGWLLPPWQLHDPVPQARPVYGRAAGALDREAPQGAASARLRLLAVAPGALLRPATTRRKRPLWRCERDQVKDVGAPCEGKPHARCEAAAGGNQRQSAMPCGVGASRRPYLKPWPQEPPSAAEPARIGRFRPTKSLVTTGTRRSAPASQAERSRVRDPSSAW